MKSCHNAANEFLRQYWSAILPAPTGALGNSSVAAKGAKAARMAGYLRGMEGKMNAVVHTAVSDGLDPMRVRAVCPSPHLARSSLPRSSLYDRIPRCNVDTHRYNVTGRLGGMS